MQLIPVYYNEMWLRLIANWRNDPKVKGSLRSAFDTNYDGQKDFVERTRKSGDQYFFIVKKEKRKESHNSHSNKSDEYNLLLGYCGLDKIHLANRTAEISLLVAPRFHRQGYGKVAIAMLLGKAFLEMNLNLIFAETYFNKRFWEKCGFNEEASLRDRKYWDGKYHDSYMLSVSRKEWEEKK